MSTFVCFCALECAVIVELVFSNLIPGVVV